MKKLMAMILTLAMVMSLCVVPASAADGKVTITITPDTPSVDTATGDAVVTYTVKAKVTDTNLKVGALTIELAPSAGLTLADKDVDTDSAFYYQENVALKYDKTYNKTGIFGNEFSYAPLAKTFVAVGATSARNLNNSTGEVVLMTIMGKIAQGTTGTVTLGTTKCTYGDVMAEASQDCDVTPATVTITSATSSDLSVAIAKPATGGTPETTITDANYTGSITWAPTIAAGGKFAASTEYTANVTLTAKGSYRFASDVKPTVAGATSVTVENVADDGSTLTFNAKFAATGTATLKDIKIIDKIDGQPLEVTVPTAAPNATATNERTFKVTGVYDDGSTATVAVNWKITTTPEPEGVSIDATTGKLTVTNKAKAGQVRVLATSAEGCTDAVIVTIKKDTPVESAIVATAPATGTNITIPNGGSTPSGQCSYKVYDQYGAEMTGASATWKMEPETVPGVTFVSANGSFSVNNTATTCTVKLHAESGTLKSNEITFNIAREASVAKSLTIEGSADSVNVPTVSKPGTTECAYAAYTAKVKDQYGAEVTGQTIEWNVTRKDTSESATGVSIDDNGKLTVTNKADAGPVTITAKSGDASKTKDVTINKEVAKATLVEIYDQGGEAPETSLLIPTGTGTNNVDYTAKVYDQYGVYMPGEMVHWALDPTPVTGVELDDTTVSGSATLKVDNTATSGTTFKLKATTATLGTAGVKELDITLTNKTPASVTTAPKAVENLKYNGDEQALVTGGTASGGTMKYSLDGTTWTDTVPKGKNAGTYTVQYKVVGDSDHTDYTPTTNTVSVSIGPKEVTVSGITAANKVYDGKNTATVNADGATFTGIVSGDKLTITATGTFADTDVGDGKTVTLTLGALGGTSVANYTLAATDNQTMTTANITPRDLTVTPEPNQSKKFGDADPTMLSYLPTGAVEYQNPDFTGKLDREAGENVGSYKILQGDLALKDNGAFKASNYTLKMDSSAVKFEITKADAPTLPDITLSQKYTVTTGEKAIGAAGMPENAGTLTYTKGTASKTGSVTVTDWKVDPTGKVTYTLSGGAAGDTVTLPVIIKSTNYADATVEVVITLTKPSYSGGGSYTPSYTVSVDKTENGTITVSPKSASKGDTVTITVKPDKGYELEMLKALDKDGDALKLTEKNGKYTFKMPSGKVTVKGSFVEEAPVQIFKDVPTDAYYYEAVKWAAEKGITGGVGNGLFGPNDPCTRAQIVTFLWRAAGSPAPKHMSSFADVPADAFYAKAVAWAVENGITGGTGDGKFSPDATCTRAQSVTFLYRAAGSPKVSSSAEFGDVATNTYYADAVAWAAKNGITGGIGGGLFGSGNDCTRAQIVTFLYRCVK